MQSSKQLHNNIYNSSNITINNSDSQNITYTNSSNDNSIMPQDTIKQIRDILMNIMQQQYLNSNMRRDKLDDSF